MPLKVEQDVDVFPNSPCTQADSVGAITGVFIVCCRDGAGRSGLVCAMSYVIERLKVEQDIDVFQSVKHVRINRPQLIPTFVGSLKFTFCCASFTLG